MGGSGCGWGRGGKGGGGGFRVSLVSELFWHVFFFFFFFFGSFVYVFCVSTLIKG